MESSQLEVREPHQLEVRQHNAITTARYEYSEIQMDLLFFLLSKLRPEDNTGKYELSIRELSQLTGKQYNYKYLRKATEDMGSRMFEVEDNEAYRQIWMFEGVTYVKGTGNIIFELTQKIRPFLYELKDNFTSFQLYAALNLSSKYAKRVYQITSQWKDKGVTPKMSIERLKRMLNVIDQEGNDKFYRLSSFKARVLEVATEQINANTDLQVGYELIKTGRTYTHLRFTIKRKKEQQLLLAFEHPVDDNRAAVCKRNLEELRIIRPDLVQQILSNPDLVAKVNAFVYDLRTQKIKATKNPAGLLLKTLGLVA